MTWHVCVYHRVTGNSIYNFEEKANRKMKRRNTQLGNNELLSIAAREEERKRRRREKKSWKGGRQEEETRDGRSTKQREKIEGWRMYIYILHTHSTTDLHAIVVNSFVF